MIQYSSKYRSSQAEIMDDFDLKGDDMKKVLTDLKNVNKWLGGNDISIKGIVKLLPESSKEETITILDLGCGDGEILRECARFAKKEGYNFQLIGVDANAFILEEARRRSTDFQNITYLEKDVFSSEFKELNFDIALCTLFLHHFSNTDLIALVQRLLDQARVGVVVNDLHRSRLAFWLFRMVSYLLIKTSIARTDGLISVARGFKRREIEAMSKEIHSSTSVISWKWAFRYSWILKRDTN
ncbi:MAG: ubiquinone/menaquinone biosynthesis C-methylase UbiE [Sediminicola sp.]|jgi:ubiquinone/menaquinone biosynthesis C-methylase UbiE|tara:strand:- start:2228 stop:2950 length:723 start_codon:yes stop_codon:yes gene_type:complete